MNGNRCTNLGAPVVGTDAARLTDVELYNSFTELADLIEAAGDAELAAIAAAGDVEIAALGIASDAEVVIIEAAGAAQVAEVEAAGLVAIGDVEDAAAALFYDDTTAGIAGTVDGEFFKTFAEDRIETYKNVTETAVLKSVSPKKADVDAMAVRVSPFSSDAFIGTAAEKILSLDLVSDDNASLYAEELFVRYVTRNTSSTFYLTVNRISDNTELASVGLNGTSIDSTGYTGIVKLPLLASSSSGITGTATVDFGDGSTFGALIALAATDTPLDMDKAMFANPGRLAVIESTASAQAELVTDVFIVGATDAYAKSMFRSVKVEGGEGDSYFLNYETITYPGIPLTRVQIKLHSLATGAVVADRSFSGSVEATVLAALPDVVKLSLVANGSVQAGYAGIEATVVADWSVIDLTKALTTYTDMSATGIHADNVVSNDEMDAFLQRPDPKAVVYVATGETYTTVQAAFDAVRNDATPFTRSTYPNSDLCTFSNQYLFQAATGHDEEIVPFEASGIWNGLLIPHYATLDLPEGARLWMDSVESAPVLEFNHSGRIRGGGEIEQFGEGYGIHIDALNILTIKGASDFLRYRHRHVIENITLRHHGTTSAAAMIGAGIADGSSLILRGVRFIREGVGIAPLVIIHTSPDSVVPSTVIFEDCYFNDELITGSTGIRLLKSHTQTVQHKLVVRNTQTGSIVVSNSVGGASGWVRQGAIDERITYTSMLDPS